jgi:RNA polymerase sigma factor (sigma-70 family)
MQTQDIRIEESALVDGCLKGDSRSQEGLYKRYSKLMYSVCCRYARDKDIAADILQDGFIRVFHSLESFRKEGSLEGWIRRIMVNTALEYHRKNAGITWIEEPEDKDFDPVVAEANGSLEAEDLMKLIQALPPGYRMVFNLYAIEGYNHREIADMLQISEGTSKSQLARARSLLQHQVEILFGEKPHAS